MTSKQEAWYNTTLEKMAHGSWEALKSFTWCCAALGIDTETAVADALALGVRDRGADIRRGIRTAIAKGAGKKDMFRRGYNRKPVGMNTIYTTTVRDYIKAGGGGTGTATEADLSALSPCDVAHMDYKTQLLSFLTLWKPTDLLYITKKGGDGTRGLLGDNGNIRTALDWMRTILDGGDVCGDIVTPNPLSGLRSINGSYIAQDCLAPCRPYLVLELDELPFPQQYAFWCGFIKQDRDFSHRLVSLVHSAGRSIHGLICVNAPDPITWQAITRKVKNRFATDPEEQTITEDGKQKIIYPFRADEQALKPITKTRLPGVLRTGTDKVQRLLYFNPVRR